MTYITQAQDHLRRLLADGRWHDGKTIREQVCPEVGCAHKTVVTALWRIGGEVDWHGAAGARYRLVPDAKPRSGDQWKTHKAKTS